MAGLLTALGYVHVRELVRGQAALLEIESETARSSDIDIAFLLSSAERFERSIALYKVRHASPLSVIIASTIDHASEQIVSFGIDLSDDEATKKALLDLVGKLQYLQHASKLPPPDEFFPDFSLRADFRRGQLGRGNLEQSGATFEQVKAYLQASGKDAFFVNTTPDDIWETGTFISGTVLLAKVAY